MSEPYTETIDGQDVVGVVWSPHKPGFYEFVNPDEHDYFQLLRCPRDGDEIRHENIIGKMMGETNGHKYVTIPVDSWLEFREYYVNEEEQEISVWKEHFERMMDEDPRFD